MGHFFKPTIIKIVLALLLPLYIGYVVEVVSVEVAGTSFDLTRESWKVTPLPYAALLFGAFAVIIGQENYFADVQGMGFMKAAGYFFLEAVLPLIITYLVSCLIMYLYYRLFPSKRNASPIVQKELEL